MAIPLAYNLRNLVARRITTGMTMLGIGLVTFIFVTMFALGVGMERTLVATGHPLNVIILRVRASESQSEVSKDQVARLAVLPGIARDAEDKPLISAELVVVANARKKATGRKANIMVRGVGESARLLRDGLELISGRWPRPSLGEIAVGRGARERFADLDLDAEPVIRDRKWKVVGIFRAGGQAYESEIWTDVDDLRAQFKRDYSVVLARMRAPAETERFCRVVKDDRDLHLDARTHADYYREQNLGAGMFKALGSVMAFVLSIGAVFGAANTMYAAVATRLREIATLRVLGFSRAAIWFSFVVESAMLGAAGGVVGAGLAWGIVDGYTTGTTNWQTFSDLAFQFRVTPELMALGVGLATGMGVVGGLFPAWRAARQTIALALRGM